MGYDFHITKAADWLEAEDHPIDRQKWLSLAVGSPALVQAGKDLVLRWSIRRGG